jgi:hypothetical protein
LPSIGATMPADEQPPNRPREAKSSRLIRCGTVRAAHACGGADKSNPPIANKAQNIEALVGRFLAANPQTAR